MNTHSHAITIVKTLAEAGYSAYFAGGWVRDHIMGHDSNDIDIATNAQPEAITALFPHTITVGAAFGVVIVNIGEQQYEVATFRRDYEYLDGRKPTRIEYCDAEEDAQRRDFTINGMFYDPISDTIHDYVGGKADIKAGVVRAIGNPNCRFEEDKLRMIRAFRFAARFAFAIAPPTYEAIVTHAGVLFPAVAMERIWHELTKMAVAARFGDALVEMHRAGLLGVLFPELAAVSRNVIEKRVAPFPRYPTNCPAILYLAALFPDATAATLETLCRYLKTSRQAISWVQSYIRIRDAHESDDDATWVNLYSDTQSATCLEVLAASRGAAFLEQHTARQQRLQHHIIRRRQGCPLVTSAMLRTAGIAPGKQMGRLLAEAERLAINEEIQNSATLIAMLQQSPLWETVS